INAWTAVGFITPTLTWGAFPGNTIDDVGSGIGIVHNALLLDHVERSVVRGPFRPFPRSLPVLNGGGRMTILPTPPWFVTARTGAKVSEGLTRSRAHGGSFGLVKTPLRAQRASPCPSIWRKAPPVVRNQGGSRHIDGYSVRLRARGEPI